MDARLTLSIGLLFVAICGCSDSAGMTYSQLPDGPIDENLVAAEARWLKILEETPIDQAAEPSENRTALPAEDSDSQDPSAQENTDQTAEESVTQQSPPRGPILDREPSAEEASAEPREIKLLIPDRNFRKESDSGSLRVSYDDIDLLKILNMEPVPVDADKHFPEWLASLNGQQIRIRGWMIPPFQSEGLKRFSLARDNGICCFVREPKVYDVIHVALTEGQTTDYIYGRPFDVQGTFEIRPQGDDEGLYSLYRLRNAVVVQ